MIDAASKLPLQHLSMRVPWHDDKWRGTICNHPAENAACLILKNVRKNRDDAKERSAAGKSFEELEQADFPACMGERAGFMAPFEMQRIISHPHAAYSQPHSLFKLIIHKHPAYSADSVPFRWMLASSAFEIAEKYNVQLVPELEEKAESLMGFPTNWLEDRRNQLAMLDTFHSAIQPEQSLCFFYAKDTPLAEDARRVIVGVGRVTEVRASREYEYSDSPTLRAVLWERTVGHSIRPELQDGFLLPYQEVLELAESDPSIDLERFAAFAPEDYWTEFSYSSEHVGHDAAISALLSCADALREAAKVLPGSQEPQLRWIDARLNELWSLRGPCPGLGSALSAFGIEHGNFVAYDIAMELEENEDPWPLVEQAFDDPSLLGKGLEKRISANIVRKWKKLSDERRALLKLLSRFDISSDQARRFYDRIEREEAGIEIADVQLLDNPYLLYELDRFSVDPIPLGIVDRGVFPDEIVREKHPLPDPSNLDDPLDERRVRAAAVLILEQTSSQGSTLLTQDDLIKKVRELQLRPECFVDEDLMPVVEDSFELVIEKVGIADGSPAYQLSRLAEMGGLIRQQVERRSKGKPHQIEADWRHRLDEEFGEEVEEDDEAEERARQEKVAALEQLAASRVSVLIGPAGTGKTTLLSVLCDHPQIKNGGVKLLAPTGKARVRLEQSTGIPTQTIAQFLLKEGRYDPLTGTHRLSDQPSVEVGRTLIIDEASMLTEEQLAATLDAVKGVQRLILVGDPRQLPPIGSGRPFVDIVDKLSPESTVGQFPKAAAGYAELTVQRRQVDDPRAPGSAGSGGTLRQKGSARDDLLLAEWFSGEAPGAGADEIWDKVESQDDSETLRFVSWRDGNDLHHKLPDVLADELGLDSRDDFAGFEQSLGGSLHEQSGKVFFWRNNYGGSDAEKIEAWQILTPVRGQAHGVYDLNRVVQKHFRRATLEWSNTKYRKIPKPFGVEDIVYGDKVINIRNNHRKNVWPKDDALEYVANGEIGIVAGQYKTKKSKFKGAPWKLEVVFSSQPGRSYDYGKRDFNQEGDNVLELSSGR